MSDDLSTISVHTLPCVSFHQPHILPETSGIYFATNNKDEVLYIGLTKNLLQRWRKHNRNKQLSNLGCTNIAYYLCNENDLRRIEKAMIVMFNPCLNGAPELDPKMRFNISPYTTELLNSLSLRLGLREREVVEVAIRELAKKQGLWPQK